MKTSGILLISILIGVLTYKGVKVERFERESTIYQMVNSYKGKFKVRGKVKVIEELDEGLQKIYIEDGYSTVQVTANLTLKRNIINGKFVDCVLLKNGYNYSLVSIKPVY